MFGELKAWAETFKLKKKRANTKNTWFVVNFMGFRFNSKAMLLAKHQMLISY